jgi:Predicted DNA-binding proteins
MPVGVPVRTLAAPAEVVALELDEYEALRLADHEGLYQEQAAGHMGVSRQTFGRTLESARRKVARALVLGLALSIEVPRAETVLTPEIRAFVCNACAYVWELSYGAGRPECCPACSGTSFHRHGCAGAQADETVPNPSPTITGE